MCDVDVTVYPTLKQTYTPALFVFWSTVGPCVWVPLPGQTLIARNPKTVKIVDTGSQEGANDWDGLNQLIETVNDTIWSSGPWVGHACDDCRKPVDVDEDDELVVQAAVIDGNTATRSEHSSRQSIAERVFCANSIFTR